MSNANDPFDNENASLNTPGDDVYLITPSDSALLPVAVRALRANGAGTIQVLTRANNTQVMNFAAGETRVVRVLQVFVTNTTATGIEGHV